MAHAPTEPGGHSPRSSLTMLETPVSPHTAVEDAERVQSPLDREIAADELNFEKYGGDDIHEPPPKLAPPPQPAPADPNQVTWDGPDDMENPQNWSRRYKWFLTTVCCVMTINVTFASSAPTSTSRDLVEDLGVSSEVSYLVTTMFLVGYVVGPLFWGPGSELLGRRLIFIIAMSSYTLFHIGQALAQNIQTLAITRFFGGFFAVAPLTNCGGVIADIWDGVGRGPATSLFTACVFLGPVLGPIIAGYIVDSSLSWRWVFWVMMIFSGTCTLVMLVSLPETYAPILLQRKAKRIRKADPSNTKIYAEHERQDWSIQGVLHRTLFRPFQMLALEPILVLVTIYLSVVYGVLYGLFEAFPIIFIRKRGFTIAQDGLIFIGVGIGTTLGSLYNIYAVRHYPALIQRWRGFPPPEERLRGGMLGGPLLVVGVFWLGWTGEYASVPWYVPALSTVLIGAAISLIFISFLSYLVDTYLMYSASAFAANTVVRSAVAAAFPLFTVQMFTALGVNWAATLLGCVALVLAPSPFLFYRYGARIRAGSRFAPCIDLRIAKELEREGREEAIRRKGEEV